MEIKLKIEATGLEKAVNNLAKALAGAGTLQVQPTEGVNKTEELKQEELAKEEAKQPPKQDKKEDAAPKITLETVRVKLAELNSAGKGAQVKALIAEFDPSDRPKLSNVSADDYAELLEKAAEI